MQSQPNRQPEIQNQIPIVACPHCVKKFPMVVRTMTSPLRGKKSEVEFICANCGTTLVQELA
jgi:DNA-directed RNA polymerase subunit RPC12/RpoP